LDRIQPSTNWLDAQLGYARLGFYLWSDEQVYCAGGKRIRTVAKQLGKWTAKQFVFIELERRCARCADIVVGNSR
jgi:hypothetical protein